MKNIIVILLLSLNGPLWAESNVLARNIMEELQSSGQITFQGLYFDYDQAVIKAQSKDALNALVVALQRLPEIHIEIAGHTDNVGSRAFNHHLSLERALAVKQYLEQHGISAFRLSAKGYGESQPVVSNFNPRGRAINRRVELLRLTHAPSIQKN